MQVFLIQNPGLLPFKRLGDEALEENRLLDCRTGVVLSRAAQLFPKPEPTGFRRVTDERRNEFPIGFDNWNPAERESLKEAAENPTSEELQDVAVIDEVFGFAPTVQNVDLRRVYNRYAPNYLGYLHNMTCRVGDPRHYVEQGRGYGNPFYCTGVEALSYGSYGTWPQLYDYFGLKPNVQWSEQQVTFHNTSVMAKTLRSYPFPSPIPAAPGFWFYENRGTLVEAVSSGLIITPPLARMMITAYTLATYETVSARIVSWAEKKAEKKKRYAIIRIAAAVAVGIIWSIGLGAILAELIPAGIPVTGSQAAGAVTDELKKKYTEDEVARMSADLEQAAKVFEVNNPLFAEEVRKLSDTFTYLGRSIEADADTAAQIAEQKTSPQITPATVGVNPEYPGPVTPPLLSVGIGALTAGALYFLVR